MNSLIHPQVAHLILSLAVVLIMRYSPAVAETYDADLDTVPRAALIAPPLVLALVFNKVLEGWGAGRCTWRVHGMD